MKEESELKNYCTLTDSELVEKAEQWLQRLIDTGGRDWSLPVPANPNKDVDLILAQIIHRFKLIHITPPIPVKTAVEILDEFKPKNQRVFFKGTVIKAMIAYHDQFNRILLEAKNVDVKKDKQINEYNPIICNHKKDNGFSAYDLLSHSSGSGPKWMHEFNLWVCLKCGEVKVSGKNLVDDKIEYFNEEFSIYYPDAVAAIVKNCNYMNTETEGYTPWQQEKQADTISRMQARIDELEYKLSSLLAKEVIK